ncbi:autotransporter outer membrane beta-barrel domain-containing protein [Pseudomonas fluorescens]|uniref:autotransporter outer membrane beta-barrel domain-containing protein n=1 Tax=Pseudomonas fluorescens TaxID=294 RepID=UPI00352674FA
MEARLPLFPIRRINKSLVWLIFSPTLLCSPLALALTTIGTGESVDIDQDTAPDNYLVRDGGVLNSNGANTFEVLVNTGATFNAVGGTYTGRLSSAGVNITNASGTLDNVTVTGNAMGMLINRASGTTTGSTATVSNSRITGVTAGVETGGGSTTVLTNTVVTATGSNGIGLNSFGADVTATGGSFTGGTNGARLRADAEGVGDGAKLTLSNVRVEGQSGAAILAEGGVNADIQVLNNTQLIAGNNLLLDVQGASTVAMTVGNSILQGNINIAGNSTGNLTFDQGQMTGDVLVEDGSTANVTLQNNSQFTGRLDKVDGVTVNSGSSWTLTGNDTVGTLAMSGGTVRFGAQDVPGTFYQLNVGTLAGSADGSSVFAMKGNFATGQHDFLNVTGVATGQFGLLVAASGLDAVSPQELTLVHTAAGDAQFALTNGRVDVGTWSYELAQRSDGAGGTDWFLDPTTQTISPGARSVLALFNTAPTVWYGESSSLRSRMGELRFNGGQSGGWMRTYGNKYNVADSSGVGYQQNQQGLSFGADARLGDSQVLVGVMGGYSKSDLNLNQGTSGTVKSYYVGPYVTWLDADTGYYFDGVLKFNRFRNESKVGLSDGTRAKGTYDNWGVGGSAEFGRHIKLDDGYFVEPFTQLSAVQIQGKRYSLDNDMDADGDRTRSVLGKAGATFGRNFDIGNGATAQPYLRAAVAHEFANNNEVKVNNNTFNNDLSGTRAEFGTGVAVAMSEKWQVHVDLDYANGEHIEQPWGGNIGVRYSW